MKLNVMLDEGAYMPEKAHRSDAGLDLRTPEEFIVLPKWSAICHTGVHVELPQNTCGFIKSRSGLNVKHGVRCEGVIDCGYTGEIVVKLYNDSDDPYTFKAGDKIAQMVVLPTPDIDLNEVHMLRATSRGDGGFGSSGR